ncbi:MFS general substrate transporter [Rhodotorula sp. JG-1b]|nr:MFS general substrate transporter [Rhodotorula sp. JG-1b]
MARDETAPLLSGERVAASQPRKLHAVKRSASLVIIPYFLFALFSGACATVEIEAIGQIACRLVVPVPVPSSSSQDRLEWEAMCRVAPDVLKKTSSVVTEILLVSGILSALTAAWWGGVSDRRGRRVVLATTSFADMVTNAMMLAVLAMPNTFGYAWLLISAVVAGVTGGQLASLAIGATYLSDLVTSEIKTQTLSLYEAANFGGMAIGPLLGPYMMRIRGLGVTAPYVGLLIVRLLFVLLLPLMPETLPVRPLHDDASETINSSSDDGDVKPAAFASRFLAAPIALLQPFRVLVPAKVDGRRSYQLPLIAASYALLMIVPGLGPVKILYGRGTFGWGPVETGRFITFTSALKIVVLLGLVPLAARLLRRTVPTSAAAEHAAADGDDAEVLEDVDPLVTSVWDLALAKTAISLALVGYLVMLIPSKIQIVPFMVGTGFTAFAAAAPPALLSLALAFSKRDDSGKVLASLSALATISVTAIGPSVFGAVYVAVLKWWSEFVFLLAALWVAKPHESHFRSYPL